MSRLLAVLVQAETGRLMSSLGRQIVGLRVPC